MSGDHGAGAGSSAHSGCLDAVRRLYNYLDGELDDDRRLTIKRHLEECVPCLEAFDFEAELRVVIARKCQERVPMSLQTRISQIVQQEVGMSAWQRFQPGRRNF